MKCDDYGLEKDPSKAMVQADAVSVLREIAEWRDRFGLRMWLDQGSALGCYREHDFLPNDNDIDISFRFKDAIPILEHLDFLQDRGFSVQILASDIYLNKNNVGVDLMGFQEQDDKYFLIECVSLKYWPARFQQAYSIAVHREKQSKIGKVAKTLYYITYFRTARRILEGLSYRFWRWTGGFYSGYQTPRHFFDNLEPIQFHGMEWLVPSPIEDYLAYKYGCDWRIPKRKWNVYVDDGGVVPDIQLVFPKWRTLKDLGV